MRNFECRKHYFDNDFDAYDDDDRDIDVEEEDRIKEDRSSPSGSVTYPLKLFDFFIKFQISSSWQAEESLQRQLLYFLVAILFCLHLSKHIVAICQNTLQQRVFTTSLAKKEGMILYFTSEGKVF